jgi:hypothetical protein
MVVVDCEVTEEDERDDGNIEEHGYQLPSHQSSPSANLILG